MFQLTNSSGTNANYVVPWIGRRRLVGKGVGDASMAKIAPAQPLMERTAADRAGEAA
jgi:hypothetical protein